MKRAQSSRRGSAATRKPAPNSVSEYLASVPEQSRKRFLEIRSTVRSAVPREAVEIISYGIPAFKHGRVLVWLAAFAKHCSLFPTASTLEKFKDELMGFPTSKGTIQFTLDKPLPKALIKKLVKARVIEAEGKKH
jgi:uncharacterized protein YdhG (YjbR/CyaY superfamily)